MLNEDEYWTVVDQISKEQDAIFLDVSIKKKINVDTDSNESTAKPASNKIDPLTLSGSNDWTETIDVTAQDSNVHVTTEDAIAKRVSFSCSTE